MLSRKQLLAVVLGCVTVIGIIVGAVVGTRNNANSLSGSGTQASLQLCSGEACTSDPRACRSKVSAQCSMFMLEVKGLTPCDDDKKVWILRYWRSMVQCRFHVASRWMPHECASSRLQLHGPTVRRHEPVSLA